MRESCLMIFRQGWLGLPIFFVGLVSLAFSQFENESGDKFENSEELVELIQSALTENEQLLGNLSSSRKNLNENQLSLISEKISSLKLGGEVNGVELSKVESMFSEAKNRFDERITTLDQRISTSSERFFDSQSIFDDIMENAGGNLDDAKTSLLVLNENLTGAQSELVALNEMLDGVINDNTFEITTITKQLEGLEISSVPAPPVVGSPSPNVIDTVASATPSGSSIRKKIFDGLDISDQSEISHKFASSIELGPNILSPLQTDSNGDVKIEEVEKLRSQLESSKTVQAELSIDSAELKSDLRKAYREIVSLQANLKESQALIDELEKTKQSLYKTDDGSPATVNTVSKRIVRLEKELDLAREDLRLARQSLLVEQKRSMAMIESITNELTRTRKQLDDARLALRDNGGDSARMAYLERELTKAQNQLKMAQLEPIDPDSSEYINLQNELRKSLGEIARMQIELSQVDELQDELAMLKSTMEVAGGSRGASPEYVNKLVIELNAANQKIQELQQIKSLERDNLSDGVVSLEEELFATKNELEVVRKEFAAVKQQIAKREFEFASTIKDLEEEAQKTQELLQESKGISSESMPFVTDMEDTLAQSEARIRLLSEQFSNEQSKATEVIASLKEELSMAQARHKESLTLLARKEFDLNAKGKQISEIENERKALAEELEVVKVIMGQLNDLNQVLEETKQTQIVQTTDADEIVDDLKDELNRAKVEIVVIADERDKLRDDFSEKIENLKRELDDTRNQMIEEQEVFAANTQESKNIILDLKNELDAAREMLTNVKAVGTTDHIEAQSAVLQLQEALGTIRILKESLDEAEQANLEVDNLKSQLADVMSRQLQNIKGVEDEKLVLLQKIENLETEIAVLRENNSGNVADKDVLLSKLRTDLEESRLEIDALRRKDHKRDESGIVAFADLEDELAELRLEKQKLIEQLAETDPEQTKTIAGLEDRLSKALAQVNLLESSALEGTSFEVELEEIRSQNQILKQQLANANSDKDKLKSANSEIAALKTKLKLSENSGINSLVVLEDELAFLKNENARLKTIVSKDVPEQTATIVRLEEELSRTVDQLNLALEQPSTSDREAENTRLAELELQLENALAKLETPIPSDSGISDAELELAIAQEAVKELTQSLDDRSLAVNQLTQELNNALERIEVLSQNADSSSGLEEVAGLQMEIETLRAELDQTKRESFSNPQESTEMAQIQEELRNAVAQSFELQMELEQTQAKLSEMDSMLAKQPEGSLDEFIAKANQAEQEARRRVEELTNALRNSEKLRIETEDLLTEMERNAKAGGQDIANDPRFLALQQEMVGLQNDLIAAQQMEDPRILQLESALEASKSDALKLNEEFKGVMSDFTKLRDELSTLEAENRRIREISLKQAQEASNQADMALQTEINNLSRENANLVAQITEKDRRIDGLRDELAGTARNPMESQLRSELVQLQIQNQTLSRAESQSKRENQQLRQDLDVARNNLRNIEIRMQENERDANSPLNQASPQHIAELEDLKVQNRSLQNQLQAMGDLPNRDRLEAQIRDLNKQNLSYKMQLDREQIMVGDLKEQLADARSIKQEVLERGKSANMKINILNNELTDSRSRVESLEKALVSAREAIRVLQSGGSERTLIPVSNPTSSIGTNIRRTGSSLSQFNQNAFLPSRRIQLPDSLNDPSLMPQVPYNSRNSISPSRSPTADLKNSAFGNSSLRLKAKVQFLDNKIRPAGFTEFFLVKDDLNTILANESIQVPAGIGIESPAEYWARSVQRGYRFPGIAAKIRNALAGASLMRIKTNSLGEGNLTNLASGRYYIIGASTLGQVGVVWSKPITLNSGDNRISLDLRDAVWAQ